MSKTLGTTLTTVLENTLRGNNTVDVDSLKNILLAYGVSQEKVDSCKDIVDVLKLYSEVENQSTVEKYEEKQNSLIKTVEVLTATLSRQHDEMAQIRHAYEDKLVSKEFMYSTAFVRIGEDMQSCVDHLAADLEE